MKSKFKPVLILLLVAIITSMVFTVGCNEREDLKDNLGYNFEMYDEDAFAKQMATGGDNKIAFASDGASEYSTIVYPDGLFIGETDRETLELEGAVEYLKSALESITSAQFNLLPCRNYADGKAFVLATDADCGASQGGYRLKITEENISILATDYEGLTCAVYAFLEEKLGCMFVARDYDYLPKLDTVYLDKQDYSFTPSVTWRYVYCDESDIPKDEDGNRSLYGNYRYSKLRLNGSGNNDWYRWVHTSFSYISPEEYFDEHPEYFSMYMGKRTYEQGPVSGQLCWTNEDVYEIISTKVLQEMRDNPDIHIWDISQMDTWESKGKGCACDACKAIDKREGSQMGSLLTFINRLADEVKKEFPDNYISTLAYNYSDEPPKNLKPRDNVIIKLCLMPGDCASSYAQPDGKYSEKGHDLVEKWGKVAKHIVIWDYNIDFHNYMMPFPVLDTLKANNDFYIENNVYGMFHQMSADKGGDFAELNSYVMARLMWDKDVDVQQIFNKFLTVYYKEAAPYIAQYYGLLRENVQKSGQQLYIYADPAQYYTSYLSPSNLDDYLDIFQEAEQAVSYDSELTNRVKLAKKGVLYVKALQFSSDLDGRRQALDEFMQVCTSNGITSLLEGEQNGDELSVYYAKAQALIKYTPLIIIAIIIGALALIAAFTLLGICIYNKVKYGKFRLEANKLREA